MRLMLVRHGKAGDREEFAKTGKPDSQRPLTPTGKKKMKHAARGLRALYPRIDVLACSPLKRATQTASLVAKAYRDEPEFIELRELSPGKRPAILLEWLKQHDHAAAHDPEYTVALTGHEPHLGRCASWLLTHKERAVMTLKKGGVCVLQFPDGVAPGRAQLESVLAPATLRRVKR